MAVVKNLEKQMAVVPFILPQLQTHRHETKHQKKQRRTETRRNTKKHQRQAETRRNTKNYQRRDNQARKNRNSLLLNTNRTADETLKQKRRRRTTTTTTKNKSALNSALTSPTLFPLTLLTSCRALPVWGVLIGPTPKLQSRYVPTQRCVHS